jgi:hypothetical protein
MQHMNITWRQVGAQEKVPVGTDQMMLTGQVWYAQCGTPNAQVQQVCRTRTLRYLSIGAHIIMITTSVQHDGAYKIEVKQT